MEVLPPHHQEIACGFCFMRPIVGARFKCKVCDNFNYCENCFYAPCDHPHDFVRIAEPGKSWGALFELYGLASTLRCYMVM